MDDAFAVMSTVAARYGLDGAVDGLRGRVSGVDVHIGHTSFYNLDSMRHLVSVTADCTPALDLAVSLRSRERNFLFDWLARFDVASKIGDVELDQAFVIGGGERQRIALLLREPTRSALLAAVKGPVAAQLYAGAGGVTLQSSRAPCESFLLWAVPTVVNIAQSFQATRGPLPGYRSQ